MNDRTKKTEDELLDLYYRSTPVVHAAMDAMVEARAELEMGHGDPRKMRQAEVDFAETMTLVLNVSALIGMRRLLLESDVRKVKYGKPKKFSALAEQEWTWPPPLPKAPFKEAVEEVLGRNPRLAWGYREVARVYTQQRGFALARSASLQATEKVRDVIAKAISEGEEELDTRRVIAATGDWNDAYAQTVYRTNMNSAYNVGRMVQAHDPDLEDFVVGFRRESAGDVDVRKAHELADGFYAGKDDPVWLRMAPPGGYNCRCSLVMIDRVEAERMGLLVNGSIPRRRAPPGAENETEFIRTSMIGIVG